MSDACTSQIISGFGTGLKPEIETCISFKVSDACTLQR